MRCAAIHRKLGTHISKVKSLSMDTWSNEQVEVCKAPRGNGQMMLIVKFQNMRKVGNVASNQIYNSDNKRAPVPVDADEADSAMERFIRQKYIHNVSTTTTGNHQPSSPRSPEGTPPPLPPKNTSKFGFRAASSIFPLSSKARKEAKAAAAASLGGDSPTLTNKPSKVFGTTVDYSPSNDTESKLQKLHELGFMNTQRNEMVLKGVNGNFEQAVESLIRLGEGDGLEKPLPNPGYNQPRLRATRSFTPTTKYSSPSASEFPMPKRRDTDRPTSSSTTSTNPYDAINRVQPQTAQSTGSLPNTNPFQMAANNPFASMASQAQLEQAFHGLNVSPQQSNVAANVQPTGFPQTLYPQSAPTSPSIYSGTGFASMNSVAYANPMMQNQIATQMQGNNVNPYFAHDPNQALTQNYQQQLAINTTGAVQPMTTPNPFLRSPTRMVSSPALGQIPEQGQSPYLTSSPVPLASPNNNPFFTPAPQPAQYYATPKHDTASILALYNQPSNNLHTTGFQPALQTQDAIIPENQAVNTPAIAAGNPYGVQSRSVSQPIPGNNPYLNSAVPTQNSIDMSSTQRKISRESMNLGKDMAWTNGRHSPDAFASLSARHV